MLHKVPPSALTEEQQYLAMEQTLTRAGYDHEAHIEERPKTTHGSFIFSVLDSSLSQNGTAGCQSEDSNPSAAGGGRIMNDASSLYGAGSGAVPGVFSVNAGSQQQMYTSPSSGSFSQRKYAQTVRSSTSSLLSLGRQKTEPPVVILPHYNSPYEVNYYNQPDVLHFVGKDLRIGTVCVSARQGQGVMHFLVRTVLKFVNVDIPDDYRYTPDFEQCRALYQKKNDLLPLLHVALQLCFGSIPESEVNRHQVVRQQSDADHSVFVLDEPGWLQSPRYISNLVRGLEEIKQEGFAFVLKNLEAQMRPSALAFDIVIPNQESLGEAEKEQFWAFFKGLGDHIEAESYLPQASKVALNMPSLEAGTKTEEQRLEALTELIETESSYNKRMQDSVNIYLKEVRSSMTALNPPMSKYEMRVVFSNIEQITAASTQFLKDLREYQSSDRKTLSLGDICRKNLQMMGCYKQYLMRYKRAQETHSALTKKNPAYRALQEKCVQTTGVQTLSNLLIEPTQRIVKYPLLFKGILSGTAEDSPDVDGLRDAAEIASQIAHMEKAKPEQRAELLFNLRSIIENCPDSLLSQNRNVITYLDGYETNLLTGERGRPITLILFSDKVMIVRRPKGVSGEVLFQLKEDEEARKRKEKEDKERKEREKRSRKDGLFSQKDGANESEKNGSSSQGSGGVASTFNILRKDWKFMGWADLLKLKIAIVEQTDPEGLFCITTRNHTETKEDLWETTRGIMPDVLDKRDAFISKFYETLALCKADAVSNGPEYTSRLHVAELELFCNVFTESQYRDFRFKGEVALFYTTAPNPPVDITPFTRLPWFVGMIQATDVGFRAVLRSKANLNGVGDTAATGETNSILDMDAFQIHVTELVANLQWTAYAFDPYQSAQLHFSRIYMDTNYLHKTASTFSKATSLRPKGLKKIRDSSGSSTFAPRPVSAGPQQRYSGSFSPLTSPCDAQSMPNSPCGSGLVGRSHSVSSYNSVNSIAGNGAPTTVPLAIPPSPTPPPANKRFSLPVMMQRQRPDSVATYDCTESDTSSVHNYHQHHAQTPPPPMQLSRMSSKQKLQESAMKNGVSVMSLLIPGPGRKKDGTVEPMEWVGMLIQRMESQGLADSKLLGELTTSDQAVIRKLSSLISNGDIELLRLELQNYSGAVVLEILRIYLQEVYDHRPVLDCSEMRARLGTSLQYHMQGQYPELVLLHSQAYLDSVKPEARIILGTIVLCYARLISTREEDTGALAFKLCSLLTSSDAQHGVDSTINPDEAPFLMDIWTRFFNNLWPELVNAGPDTRQLSTPSSPISPLSPSDTLYSFSTHAPSMRNCNGVTPDNRLSSMSQSVPVPAAVVPGDKGLEGRGDAISISRSSTPAPTSASPATFSSEKARLNSSQDAPVSMKFKPSEAAEKALRHAKQNKDEIESKTIHNRQSIESLRTQMKQLRGSVVDGYKGIHNHLTRLSTSTKSIASSTTDAPSRSHSITSLDSRNISDSTTETPTTPDLHAIRQGMVSPSPSLNLNGQPLSPSSSSSSFYSQMNNFSPTTGTQGAGLRPPLFQSGSQSSIASDVSGDSALSSLTAQSSDYGSTVSGGRAESESASVHSEESQTSGRSSSSSGEDNSGGGSSDGNSFTTAVTSSHITIHRSSQSTASMTSIRTHSRSSSVGGSSSIGSIYLGSRAGDRPLPLTPMQEMLLHQTSTRALSVRRQRTLSESHLSPLTAATAPELDEDGINRSKSTSSNGTLAVKPASGSMGVVYEGLRVLQEQVSLTEARHLKNLDQCVDAAVESRMEDLMRWESLSRQYDELIKQLAAAKAYQTKLEHENAAIKDLYDEAAEENNIIFERFNDELEGIFDTMNMPSFDDAEETRGLVNGHDIYHDREATPIPQHYNQHHSTRSNHGSSPPLPPIPMLDVNFDFELAIQDLDRHPRKKPERPPPSQPTTQQLLLLKKAIQDRSLAEQQARRSAMQATYLRSILEKHGIQAETEDLF